MVVQEFLILDDGTEILENGLRIGGLFLWESGFCLSLWDDGVTKYCGEHLLINNIAPCKSRGNGGKVFN